MLTTSFCIYQIFSLKVAVANIWEHFGALKVAAGMGTAKTGQKWGPAPKGAAPGKDAVAEQ